MGVEVHHSVLAGTKFSQPILICKVNLFGNMAIQNAHLRQSRSAQPKPVNF